MDREKFRQALEDELGNNFVYSYFDRSGFVDDPSPTLQPWSFCAERQLKTRARLFLQREGVKLGSVIADHLKEKRRA